MLSFLTNFRLTSWWQTTVPHSWDTWLDHNSMLMLQIFLGVVAIVLLGVFLQKRLGSRGLEVEAVQKIMGLRGPRFRKRDKMLFYTKRIWRNMNTLTSIHGGKRLKKRQVVLRLAKRILFPKREQPQLKVKGPSQAFLEEDLTEHREDAVPSDFMCLIRSIRLFGFLEKPLFFELYKHIVTIDVDEGDMLFNVGDQDDSIYMIASGCISVFIKDGPDELVFKEAKAGDSIASFLSALEVIANRESKFKSVAARATQPSKVVRLRYTHFSDLLKQHPYSMLRLVQNVMIRLQRVDFSALHDYLGLTHQMMKSRSERNKSFINSKSSPVKSGVPARKTSMQPPPSSVPHTPVHGETADTISSQGPFVEGAGSILTKEDATSKKANKQSAAEVRSQIKVSNEPASPGRVKSIAKVKRKKTNKGRRASVVGGFVGETTAAELPESECLRQAAHAFMKNMSLNSEDVILNKLTIRDYNPGEKLTTQNDNTHINHLYYIISGVVEVRLSTMQDAEKSDEMYTSHPGDIVGIFETLTSDIPFVTRVARTRVRVACLKSEDAYLFLGDNPYASLYLALNLIDRLSPFLRQIDFAMDWVQIESGRAIFRQGDFSDAMYIVLSGRLRAVITENGKKRMVGEFGRGDLVGLVELLTETPRATTVISVRDTELAKLPVGLVNVIKIKYQVVVSRLIQILGQHYMGTLRDTSANHDGVINRKAQSNFSTIAILPVSEDVPLRTFTLELNYALRGHSKCLTSDSMKEVLGPNALDKSNEYRLCSYLSQLEDRHKILLYECDKEFTPWTQRCIRQADCILIVAMAEKGPQVGTLEIQAENIAKRTQKELILLHAEDGPPPQNTVEWLNIRSWCSSHHHLRCPKRVMKRVPSKRLKAVYEKLETPPYYDQSHFGRLARFLTGTSIGLVLGGGGARGCSHVGMIRAILEAGIPIDMIGGVSIGAFMGALYAQELDVTTMTQKARDWAYQAVAVWQQMFDITYPITSWFTGRAFNRGIHNTFGDKLIEDLWLPYFNVTTDITSSCTRVHRHGSLWSYVRSSMSLAGIMPPLCDPIDGHLLLDGGYVNNLPADVMYRDMGAHIIIAVDVGSQDESDLTNYGDSLSGWWLLWKRSPFGFGEAVKIPNSAEIQSRLAYVSCVRQLEEVKTSDYCTYVRPPIDRYKTLQFNLFNEIMDVGYQHGKTLFAGMKAGLQDKNICNILTTCGSRDETSSLPVARPVSEGPHEQRSHPKLIPFDDLAMKVCKVKRPQKEELTEEDLSENLDDYTSQDEM